MIKRLKVFALSIDPSRLEQRLLRTLYENYDKESIKKYGFEVVCQGFSDEDYSRISSSYPEITFHKHDKIKGSISYIRNTLTREYNLFTSSEYAMLIDDDFLYYEGSLDQYNFYLEEMDKNPNVGLLVLHQNTNKKTCKEFFSIECTRLSYLHGINMRCGLLIRSSAIPEQGLFDDRICFHEEFYLALMIYINGYDIAKGLVNTYHKSSPTGLGRKLQKELDIYNNADKRGALLTSREVAHDMGYLDLYEQGYYYNKDKACCKINSKARREHDENKSKLIIK